MKRTSANLWYSHNGHWKLERQDNANGEGGVVGVLTHVKRSSFDGEDATRTFPRFEDALTELSRLEGPRAYVDEWLAYMRKAGGKVEAVAFEMTCLACDGLGTSIDTTKTLKWVPVVTCPRCGGTGKETVETAK